MMTQDDLEDLGLGFRLLQKRPCICQRKVENGYCVPFAAVSCLHAAKMC